jgi:glutathione S-transferase
MEEALAKSAWLAGDRYSLADIGAVPFIKRIDEEIAPDEMKPARHPKVAAWWASIQARPAFATARIGPFTAGH